MVDPLMLYELPPSPNNIKARIALGYKGLGYERRPLVSLSTLPGQTAGMVEGCLAKHLRLGDDRAATRAWVARVLAHDR